MSALEISEFNDLVTEKARITVGNGQVAFTLFDWKSRRKLGRSLTCGVDDSLRLEDAAVTQVHYPLSDGDHFAVYYDGAMRGGVQRQTLGSDRRVQNGVGLDEKCAFKFWAELWFKNGELVF